MHTDPAVVLPLADGDAIVMSRDRDATAAELARWDPADGEAYLRLLADWEGGLAGGARAGGTPAGSTRRPRPPTPPTRRCARAARTR